MARDFARAANFYRLAIAADCNVSRRGVIVVT
jgi:hypothetical protein